MNASMHIIPLFVVLALTGAFLISILGRRFKLFADICAVTTTFLLLLISFKALEINQTGQMLIYDVGAWKPPIGISLMLDGLTAFMLITVNLIAFLICLFAINYMEKYTSKWKFHTLFLLMLAGMNGVIITGDIFNLFVFLEIASVASYALVAFGTERHELEAAFKYAMMSTLGSFFILLSIIFLYSYTSTLNLADMAMILAAKGPSNVLTLSGILLFMGFGLKAALFPFHAWLPDAHPSAPAPISAMLSGILIKSLGIYTLIRLFFNVLGLTSQLQTLLLILGTLSMVIGVFLAIGQWDLKRLLAYHSISQIGYIFLGLGLGTPLGIAGGLFHLFNHSVFKSLLFLNSGSLEYTIGTRDLKKMGGLMEKLPVTGATNLIASMSIAGIPPFNGFWSKLLIIIACVQANRYGYAFWAVLASIMTLASFMKVTKYAFYGQLSEKFKDIIEAPYFMRLAMSILAAICITSGLLFLPYTRELFLMPAVKVLNAGVNALFIGV